MNDKEIEQMSRAESTYWWFRAKDDLILDLLGSFGSQKKKTRLLDIGCGTGRLLGKVEKKLKGFDAVLTGVDASAAALKLAGSATNAHLLSGSLPDVLHGQPAQSVIIASDVLEHIEDDRKFLVGIYELLEPGGIAILTVPAFNWLWSTHDTALDHKRRYTLSDLKEKLKSAGFQVVYIKYFFTLLFPFFVFFRIIDIIKAYIFKREHNTSQQMVLPVLLNKLFYAVCTIERRGVRLPFGSSVVCIARKD